MAGASVCLFSVAAHSVSLTTHFDLTSFHAVMVHFGNMHHEQKGDTVGSDSAFFSVRRFSCVSSRVRAGMFVYICRCARVCQRAFTKGSALGVPMHLRSREKSKGDGSDLAHSTCRKQPTGCERLAWIVSAVHSLVLIYLFWLGGKCMFSGVGYQ